MAYELKDGQGSLFPNDRKEKDNHPDWRGTFKLEGKLYEISSWWKESPGKTGFHSLAVKPKEPRKEEW